MPWVHRDPVRVKEIDRQLCQALDDTTAEAAIFAKNNHQSWKNVTGVAEGSIRMEPSRRVSGNRIRGVFGSFDVNYFIYLEFGNGNGYMGDHTLRRAADATFPNLARNLHHRLAFSGRDVWMG